MYTRMHARTHTPKKQTNPNQSELSKKRNLCAHRIQPSEAVVEQPLVSASLPWCYPLYTTQFSMGDLVMLTHALELPDSG